MVFDKRRACLLQGFPNSYVQVVQKSSNFDKSLISFHDSNSKLLFVSQALGNKFLSSIFPENWIFKGL